MKFTIIKETDEGWEPVAFLGAALIFNSFEAAMEKIYDHFMAGQWDVEQID
jgi:hypothetical protein